MSEENVPKLRLKPKLAAEPISVVPPPPPVANALAQEVPPAVPVDETKAVRLKPKLAPEPASSTSAEPKPAPVDQSQLIGALTPSAAPRPAPEPVVEEEKQPGKFSLKPKASSDSPAAAFPPPPRALEQPMPPPPLIDAPEPSAIKEIPALRPVTAKPFPPPPANFPPPPAGGGKPAPPWARTIQTPARSKKKTFLVIGGCVVVALLVLGGAFFAYLKFSSRSATPAQPKVVAQPPKAVEPAPALEEKETADVATAHEAPVSVAATASIKKADVPVVPETEVVEAPPPPPPPSAPFKAWVDNLRVGGVRGGANTRVFIGGTAYEIGDMVNPQLGIAFEGYNVETRKLIFKDKTGATVERRN